MEKTSLSKQKNGEEGMRGVGRKKIKRKTVVTKFGILMGISGL